MSSSRPHAPATLAADLRRRDDAALEALLRARPDLLSPVPSDLTSLAARATTKPSVTRALDELDLFTLQVLDVLCLLPEPTTPAEVAAALGADPGDATGRLVERALAYEDEAGLLYVPRAVREVVGSPAGLGPPVDTLLAAYGPRRLEQLWTDLGDNPRTVLADPERTGALLAEVSPAAREALDTLTWGPPSGRLDGATREVTLASARSPVEELLARGLLVASDARTVTVPREVALHLRGRVHRDPQPTMPAVETAALDRARADRQAAGAAATVVRQVEDLLELWAGSPPRVLRAGGVGVRDAARTAAALEVDEATFALLAETAVGAGLLARGDDPVSVSEEFWMPTEAYDDWLDLPTADRWLTLVEAWLRSTRTPGLIDLADGPDKRPAVLGPDLDRTLTPELRQAVLAELAAVPVDEQTTPESVLARLRWRAPRRGGWLRDEVVGWTVREAAALGVTGGTALATYARLLLAGKVDAACDSLTRLLPVPVAEILLQADLTAIAPGPLVPDLARRLRLTADVESTGGATVYRFSAASIRRALDAGWAAADLNAFLARASRTPVPQPLTYLVDDVARRHGQVRVGAASAFVRCDDEATVGELLTDRRAAGLRLHRLAPTVLAAQAPVDTLLERLRAMGYAPVAETPGGEVVIRSPEARRSRPRQTPYAVTTTGPRAPEPRLLAAAVTALRAGELAVGVPVARPIADVLAMLVAAAGSGEQVLIDYVDAEGRGTSRMIEPQRVEGGYVTAYDHLRQATRHFALARITGVALVGENGASD